MPVAPEFERLLEASRASEAFIEQFLQPELMRTSYDSMAAEGHADPPPIEQIEDLPIDGPGGPLHLRIYTHGPERGPLTVFFHGGGFVIGNLDTHDAFAREIVGRTGGSLVSVDYRLSPEHPYPEPAEDCFDATTWAVNEALRLRVDTERVFVMGDSAGGALAGATALRARDEDGPKLAGQILVYPICDRRYDWPSFEEVGSGHGLTTTTLRWFFDCYASHLGESPEPYAFPAESTNLGGLPPTYLATAGYDPLRDAGVDYARRLTDAGVETTHRSFPTMIHGFGGMSRFTPTAYELYDDIATFIGTH